MSLSKLLTAFAVSVLIGGLTAGPATAKRLKAAVGLGQKSAQVFAYKSFAKEIEAKTDLKIKVFSMSLLNLKLTSVSF